jgi:hypothetical protein
MLTGRKLSGSASSSASGVDILLVERRVGSLALEFVGVAKGDLDETLAPELGFVREEDNARSEEAFVSLR